MTPAEIYAELHRRPFVPFRIVTTDGTIYEVRHPELVMVGSQTVLIGYPTNDSPVIFDHYDRVALIHIVHLELAQAAPQGQGNAAP